MQLFWINAENMMHTCYQQMIYNLIQIRLFIEWKRDNQSVTMQYAWTMLRTLIAREKLVTRRIYNYAYYVGIFIITLWMKCTFFFGASNKINRQWKWNVRIYFVSVFVLEECADGTRNLYFCHITFETAATKIERWATKKVRKVQGIGGGNFCQS